MNSRGRSEERRTGNWKTKTSLPAPMSSNKHGHPPSLAECLRPTAWAMASPPRENRSWPAMWRCCRVALAVAVMGAQVAVAKAGRQWCQQGVCGGESWASYGPCPQLPPLRLRRIEPASHTGCAALCRELVGQHWERPPGPEPSDISRCLTETRWNRTLCHPRKPPIPILHPRRCSQAREALFTFRARGLNCPAGAAAAYRQRAAAASGVAVN